MRKLLAASAAVLSLLSTPVYAAGSSENTVMLGEYKQLRLNGRMLRVYYQALESYDIPGGPITHCRAEIQEQGWEIVYFDFNVEKNNAYFLGYQLLCTADTLFFNPIE